MKAPTTEELLNAWELGLNQPLLQRALFLLIAAFPETRPEALLKLSIGQRDLRLLRLRELLFGPQLLNTAVCPGCEQRIEWENNVTDFIVQPDQDKSAGNDLVFESQDYSVRFRLPNSLDLATVSGDESGQQAEQHLLSRCLIRAEYCGSSCDASQLPDSVIETLNRQIEQLDPQADIRVALDCPACTHSWVALFDIASFLCSEVNNWAEQMLKTVHTLASGYGWSQAEILKLSPVRRQLYIGMLKS